MRESRKRGRAPDAKDPTGDSRGRPGDSERASGSLRGSGGLEGPDLFMSEGSIHYDYSDSGIGRRMSLG